MLIESGLGNGKLAGVDDDNRLITASFNIPFEHLIAKDYARTFTVFGTATPIAGTANVLFLRNDNQRDYVVISGISVQAVELSGGSALPDTGNLFSVALDSEYTSGGSAVTPSNMTSGSSVVSNVVCYEDAPSATGVEAYRMYPASSDMIDLDVKGALIIPPSKGMLISFTSDNTAGVALAQVDFQVVSSDGYSG